MRVAGLIPVGSPAEAAPYMQLRRVSRITLQVKMVEVMAVTQEVFAAALPDGGAAAGAVDQASNDSEGHDDVEEGHGHHGTLALCSISRKQFCKMGSLSASFSDMRSARMQSVQHLCKRLLCERRTGLWRHAAHGAANLQQQAAADQDTLHSTAGQLLACGTAVPAGAILRQPLRPSSNPTPAQQQPQNKLSS